MALSPAFPDWLDDVTITVVPALDDLPSPVAQGVLWQAAPDRVIFDIPRHGRLEIGRHHLRVTPPLADHWAEIGPFLRSTPLAVTTFLRGGLACQAAAVAGPDGGVLVMGDSVTGKTALALALMRRGARLLADDAAPIVLDADSAARLVPVWPQMRLWPDTIAALIGDPRPDWLAPMPPPAPGYPPYGQVTAAAFANQTVPLRAIYLLKRDNRLSEPTITDGPRGMQRLADGALIPFHGELAVALMPRLDVPRIYAATNGAPLRIVTLPQRGLHEIDHIADTIMQDCGWPIRI